MHIDGERGIAMNYGQYISIDPEILRGKPCIAGHRISVEMILEMLGLGDTIDDILNVYPQLTREQILAAIMFAHDALRTR